MENTVKTAHINSLVVIYFIPLNLGEFAKHINVITIEVFYDGLFYLFSAIKITFFCPMFS